VQEWSVVDAEAIVCALPVVCVQQLHHIDIQTS
jgi:hypothetical protein